MKLAYKYLKSYSVEPITKWMKIKTKQRIRNADREITITQDGQYYHIFL